METYTPQEIVTELDKYIIGQNDAKKSVAVALRNRYRRSRLPKEQQEEISPKNIIMIGPTGVGKTEIARRLAKLVQAPFVKVEATKFTEVGYVGRDVESMIRDLLEAAIRMVNDIKMQEVEGQAEKLAEENLKYSYLYRGESYKDTLIYMEKLADIQRCLGKETEAAGLYQNVLLCLRRDYPNQEQWIEKISLKLNC